MNKEHLVTAWSKLFISDPILLSNARFSTLEQYSHEYINKIHNLDEIIPLRTFSMRHVFNGKLIWKSRNKEYKFNNFELFLLEHCSGKSTLSDIIARANSYWGNKIPNDQISSDVISYLNKLIDEMLMVYRYFPSLDSLSKDSYHKVKLSQAM